MKNQTGVFFFACLPTGRLTRVSDAHTHTHSPQSTPGGVGGPLRRAHAEARAHDSAVALSCRLRRADGVGSDESVCLRLDFAEPLDFRHGAVIACDVADGYTYLRLPLAAAAAAVAAAEKRLTFSEATLCNV